MASGGAGAERVTPERFAPRILTCEPRAATGTLEALRPVAVFTKPVICGAFWACAKPVARQNKQLRRFPIPDGISNILPQKLSGNEVRENFD
jgi:hypothetical protein